MKNKKYNGNTPLLIGSIIVGGSAIALGVTSIVGITMWSITYGNPKFNKNNTK
ncbi:hypothetical protein B808_1152 [Fructilactobacillus florum 8D]|uniref:Uncharacterized protein n=2 Tax=Fructilactobacillus florum TaxID=640331 RepID=W9ED41_9LACO|nr:hypothetical protein [Fructilactobacillus florum]ETO40043.1 hypothetical protein B808_1152 [Fructilactobacillus florum 8D]KRM91701.1 hypothetical protein FC87_GL000838 [Fructilactobacillus florum DSM 22689 = JCM 16035]